MTNTSVLHPRTREFLDSHGLIYKTFACDPSFADTAAFCQHYGFEVTTAANAMIVASKTEPIKFVCCVILASTKLDVNKKVCQLLGVKRASFATAEQTIDLTGMQIGGVTPFGLPDFPIYVDAAVMNNEEIVLGGGNRSSKTLMNPAELKKLSKVEVIEALALPR